MDSGSFLRSNPRNCGTTSLPCDGRRQYRHRIASLAYVRLDHANGGIIRNLSQSGIAIQAVGQLHPGQVVHLRFELLKPRVRVETTGQVTWADASGQAGIRFVDLSPRPSRLLNDWIFTDLLVAASELAPARAPIFAGGAQNITPELIISPRPIPPIRLTSGSVPMQAPASFAIDDSPQSTAEMPIRLAWWPVDIAPGTLAGFIDSLIIVSAILLFSVVFVATIGELPSWLMAGALVLGSGAVFGSIYCYLFQSLAGATVGRRMARLAAEDMHWVRELRDENAPRFR